MRAILRTSLAAFGLAACATPLHAKPPAGHLAFVGSDTVLVSYTCGGAAPNVACKVSAADSGSTKPLASNLLVNVGQSVSLGFVVCPAPGARVTITGTQIGVGPTGYTDAAGVPISGSATCPTKAANPAAGTFTLTVKGGE